MASTELKQAVQAKMEKFKADLKNSAALRESPAVAHGVWSQVNKAGPVAWQVCLHVGSGPNPMKAEAQVVVSLLGSGAMTVEVEARRQPGSEGRRYVIPETIRPILLKIESAVERLLEPEIEEARAAREAGIKAAAEKGRKAKIARVLESIDADDDLDFDFGGR